MIIKIIIIGAAPVMNQINHDKKITISPKKIC